MTQRNSPTTPRRLLLALPAEGLPTQSLRRAWALSRLRDAELHVLRVSPTPASSFPMFPHFNGLRALETIAHQLELLEATRAWLAQIGGEGCQLAALETREGDFVTQVADHARELGAELIVLAPVEGPFGAQVTALARAAAVPVLVVRAAAGEVIVAASDLTDGEYPVLRAATALGAALSADVVAVHNVAPAPVTIGHELAWVMAAEAADALSADRLAQLERASAQLGGQVEAVVTRAVTDSEAVLEIARRRDADLVVVGTREQSPLTSLFRPEVAAQVIERSARSVLVLPLDEQSDSPRAWS